MGPEALRGVQRYRDVPWIGDGLWRDTYQNPVTVEISVVGGGPGAQNSQQILKTQDLQNSQNIAKQS